MLDYIYMGEVKVPQDNLDKFLQISDKFQLQGLLGGKDDTNKGTDPSASKPKVKNENISLDYDSQPATNIARTDRPAKRENREPSLKVCDETFETTNTEVEEKFQELIIKEGSVFRCTMCDRTMTHKGSMRRHLETHLTGLNYNCHLCDETFRSSMSLSNHKRWHRYPSLF